MSRSVQTPEDQPRRSGHLFEGYGGLSMAADAFFGTDPAWHSEIEPAAVKLLEHHYPDRPNLGDITAVDWADVEPVDIVTGGYPCQPFSAAGKRAGDEDERYLWPAVADCLSVLRPAVFLGENVRGHLTLGFDQVVRDLDLIGYDVSWSVVRAADVGAPHGRARLFMVGRDRGGRVRGGAGGRRGLHRDQPRQGCGLLRDHCGRRDGDQVDSDPQSAGEALGRAAERCEAGDGTQRPEDSVADRGTGRGSVPASDRAAPGLEDAAGSDLSRPTRRDRAEPGGPGTAPLVSRTSRDGADREGAGGGTQRPRPPARSADSAAGSTAGGASMGGVVGAGRVAVRARAVQGELPGQRGDDRGPRVRPELHAAGDDRGRAQWPAADSAHLGHERGGSARDGWPGPADGGDRAPADTDSAGREGPEPAGGRDVPAWGPVADAESERRGEGRSEPAGVVRGPDAPPGGGEPSCRTCGHPEHHHDHGGTCASCPGGECSDPELGRPAVADADGDQSEGRRSAGVVACSSGSESGEGIQRERARDATRDRGADAGGGGWGAYEPAIRRWEHTLGRPAPAPTQRGTRGGQQLSPRFVEWLMGLSEGWVTDVPGLTRNQQLKLLGNGVVPQQADLALHLLTAPLASEAAA